MSEQQRFRLYLTGPARRDIAAIERYSFKHFGEEAALRYNTLIEQALIDIQTDPAGPGAKSRPDIFSADVRVYHLSFSRKRLRTGYVREPRYFIIYRQRSGNVIEIERILHDSRDLTRHVPGSMKAEE